MMGLLLTSLTVIPTCPKRIFNIFNLNWTEFLAHDLAPKLESMAGPGAIIWADEDDAAREEIIRKFL